MARYCLARTSDKWFALLKEWLYGFSKSLETLSTKF